MGTWGTKLYENDLALDIRAEYEEGVATKKNNKTITQQILSNYKNELQDCDEAPIIWFTLADCQWRTGKLQKLIKETAIGYIDSKIDLQKWNDEKQRKEREIELAKLKAQLLSPYPEKMHNKNRKLYSGINDGDIFCYQLSNNRYPYCGKYIAMQKVFEKTIDRAISVHFQIFNATWNSVPSVVNIIQKKPLATWYESYDGYPHVPGRYSMAIFTNLDEILSLPNIQLLGNEKIVNQEILNLEKKPGLTSWLKFEFDITKLMEYSSLLTTTWKDLDVKKTESYLRDSWGFKYHFYFNGHKECEKFIKEYELKNEDDLWKVIIWLKNKKLGEYSFESETEACQYFLIRYMSDVF